MSPSSPLLDQYNRDGVVTPALQRALDMARQTLGQNAGLTGTSPATPAGPVPRLTNSPSPAPALSPGPSPAPISSLLGGEPRPESQQMPAPKPMTVPEQHLQRLTDVTTGEGAKSGAARIHNPWLRIPTQVLSAIGDAFLPGITQYIPGGELHHQGLVNMARANVNQDQAQATAEAGRKHMGAETQELASRAKHEEASGKLADQQAATLAEEGKRTPKSNYITFGSDGLFDASEGKVIREPTDKTQAKYADLDLKALGLGEGSVKLPVEAIGPYLTGKLRPAPKESDQETFIQRYLKEHSLDDNATNREKALKAHSTAAQSPERPQRDPQSMMLEPDGNGGYITRVLRGAGEHVGGSVVTPSTASAQNAPTTQMRNVAAQAQLVHEQTPHMLSEIDRLKDKLGPVSGRWNEFMQGQAGMNDPDMAGLRADLLMYSSAVALMHARGRLPENLRAEFDRAINAPKQSPENLKSVISRIDDWSTKNSQSMGGHAAPSGGEEWVRDANGKLVKK